MYQINTKRNANRVISFILLVSCFYVLFSTNDRASAEGLWSGSYYNNKALSGKPVKSEYDAVKFNWGKNAPIKKVKADGFSAKFEKSMDVNEQKDYFLTSYADDAIRTFVDNKVQIDNWRNSSGKFNMKALPNMAQGHHTIRSEYYENTNNAALYSEILPFNSWIGYYFNNTRLKGAPQDAFILNENNDTLSFNYGNNAPGAKNIGADNYSVKLSTFKRLPAGEYIIKTKVNEMLKVYIDGKKIIDQPKYGSQSIKIKIADTKSKSNKDVHEIRLEYVEKKGKSYLDFSIKPLQTELSYDNWLSTYHNNQNLAGTANVYGGNSVARKINGLFFNWDGKPNAKTNNNNFSASYYKLLRNGDYFVHAIADDGAKASINGQSLFSRWSGSGGKENKALITGLTNDDNTLRFDYLEKVKKAYFTADAVPFGQWLAYYYPNTTISGLPKAKTILNGNEYGNLSFDLGKGAPIAGIPADNYSAKFMTAMRLPAGKYVIDSFADDGVKIYVDDKLVVNRWTKGNSRQNKLVLNIDNRSNETGDSKKDVHWIRVEYLEKKGKSKLNFTIKPLTDFITSSDWLGVSYPNNHLSGEGSIFNTNNIRYNWGKGAGFSTTRKDGFSASFYKKISGFNDYFVYNFADDGLRVKVDDQNLISRWKNSGGRLNSALIKNLSDEDHKVQIDYYENTGNATLAADVLPLGDWVAYYYNNKELTGHPSAVNSFSTNNSMTLEQDFGFNGPANGIKNDMFSAKYVTAKRLEAGEYIVRGLSDDGMQVFIDGKPVINQWNDSEYREKATKVRIDDTNNDNIHWIEVRYYDNTNEAKFKLSLTKYDEGNVVDSSGWLAQYFSGIIDPNNPPSFNIHDAQKTMIVGGKDSLNHIENINFDWQQGSPDASIPNDQFSAIYKKVINVGESGNYNFVVTADDGVILEIDGIKMIDSWNNSVGDKREYLGYYLPQGDHTVVLKYYDDAANASIKFEMSKAQNVLSNYFYLNKSLDQHVQNQMYLRPQTDTKYKAYIMEDALTLINNGTQAITKSGKWNVRGGPSTDFWSIGTLSTNNKVDVIAKSTMDNFGKYWYEINYYKYYVPVGPVFEGIPLNYKTAYHAWVNASPNDVKNYLDPNNFLNDERQKLQFLDLASSANLNETEVNEKILWNKGIFVGKAGAFMQAGATYGVNEIYLIAHSMLETGNGKSQLATGVTVSKVDGKDVEPKVVYNMYGIGAYDSSPLKSGSEYAYKQGWFTPEAAIIGGAKFIGQTYINHPTYKQNTLFEMRWNPSHSDRVDYGKMGGSHQYATDIGWASKQVNSMYYMYSLLSSYRMTFDIPTFK
ncbi:PA14 domain-containing protein [Niallia sp. 01092]|uniref:PA14 domain-containing protein n=1 Tax=Niallia sp. 01092 TaxID=3457759 RepID=UPI003FD582A1